MLKTQSLVDENKNCDDKKVLHTDGNISRQLV